MKEHKRPNSVKETFRSCLIGRKEEASKQGAYVCLFIYLYPPVFPLNYKTRPFSFSYELLAPTLSTCACILLWSEPYRHTK